MMIRNKYSIEFAKNIALKNGGKCLSDTYININQMLYWKCSNPAHDSWKSSLNNIIKGSWCPKCRLDNQISKIDSIILSKNGKWNKNQYINSYTKVDIECEFGHSWKTTPAVIFQGSWCPKCFRNHIVTESNSELFELVRLKDGIVIDFDNKGSLGKAVIQCAKGHLFETTQTRVKSGAWCELCSREFRKASLEEFVIIAASRGGKCLSDIYEGAFKKLKFQCINGHVWEAKPNAIKNGTWCPECNATTGENIVRMLLELIFKNTFPKSYPDWLISDKGKQLELDGYNYELKIAFEHQGEHHLTEKSLYSKNFQRRQYLDNLKRQLCKENGVILLEINQAGERRTLEEIIESLKLEFVKNGLTFPDQINYSSINYGAAYIKDNMMELEKIKKIAESKNGSCLSPFYGGHYMKLEFICNKGHKWYTDPATIKRGRWCPKCARERLPRKKPKYTIQNIRDIAKAHGGECLSDIYTTGEALMKFRCANGHIWETKAFAVIYGSWCQSCAASENNKKRKKT